MCRILTIPVSTYPAMPACVSTRCLLRGPCSWKNWLTSTASPQNGCSVLAFSRVPPSLTCVYSAPHRPGSVLPLWISPWCHTCALMHSLSSSPEGRIGQWDCIAYSNTLRPVLPMGQPQFLHGRPIKFSWYVATIPRPIGLIATYATRLASTLFHSPSCRPSS